MSLYSLLFTEYWLIKVHPVLATVGYYLNITLSSSNFHKYLAPFVLSKYPFLQSGAPSQEFDEPLLHI